MCNINDLLSSLNSNCLIASDWEIICGKTMFVAVLQYSWYAVNTGVLEKH